MGAACFAPVLRLQADDSAKPFRSSAEIVKDARLSLADSREQVRRMAPALFWAAFPAASQHQVCQLASRALGVSPATVDRIINGYTASPDLLMLVHVARIYEARTGKDSPIVALIARILRGAA